MKESVFSLTGKVEECVCQCDTEKKTQLRGKYSSVCVRVFFLFFFLLLLVSCNGLKRFIYYWRAPCLAFSFGTICDVGVMLFFRKAIKTIQG